MTSLPSGVTFSAVSAGGYHSIAIGSNGKLYSWGDNTDGQLGDGTRTHRAKPVAVSPGAVRSGVTFSAVSAGTYHSIALGSDGKVYSWGGNAAGELGNGTTTNSSVPVAVAAGVVPSGVTFSAVSAGSNYSMALGSGGKAYSWGSNGSGQLGDGGVGDSSVPVAVDMTGFRTGLPSGVTFRAVAAGGRHSIALGSDGKVYSWGYNYHGQLGTGDTHGGRYQPVAVVAGAVPSGVTFSAVSAGSDHSIALGSDGKVYSWGNNDTGQLGDGSANDSSVPVAVVAGAVPSGVTFSAVSAGNSSYSIALGSDGKLYSWGYNYYGQLGDGGVNNFSSSVPVLSMFFLPPSAANPTQKLNAGSFQGYIAIYAKGYEGRKLSAKVAGKWLKVESLGSNFERILRYTGAGYDIEVDLYIDGALFKQMELTTR
jgi:alpha-tubulin suppressor-like RCC1 family protein